MMRKPRAMPGVGAAVLPGPARGLDLLAGRRSRPVYVGAADPAWRRCRCASGSSEPSCDRTDKADSGRPAFRERGPIFSSLPDASSRSEAIAAVAVADVGAGKRHFQCEMLANPAHPAYGVETGSRYPTTDGNSLRSIESSGGNQFVRACPAADRQIRRIIDFCRPNWPILIVRANVKFRQTGGPRATPGRCLVAISHKI